MQLYEFWLKSGLIEYQQGHLEGIFLANFCKIFFRFEGSLLVNCRRQSVEEYHYGNYIGSVLFSPQYCSSVSTPGWSIQVSILCFPGSLSCQDRRGEGCAAIQLTFLSHKAGSGSNSWTINRQVGVLPTNHLGPSLSPPHTTPWDIGPVMGVAPTVNCNSGNW